MKGPQAAPIMSVHPKKPSVSSKEGHREQATGPAPKITVKVLTEAARNADRLRQEIAGQQQALWNELFPLFILVMGDQDILA